MIGKTCYVGRTCPVLVNLLTRSSILRRLRLIDTLERPTPILVANGLAEPSGVDSSSPPLLAGLKEDMEYVSVSEVDIDNR